MSRTCWRSGSTTATRPGTTSTASIFATGERELLYENRNELAGVVLDRQLHPRLALKPRDKEGGHVVYRIVGAGLEPMMVIEHEDDLTTTPWASRRMAPRSTGSPR